MPLLLSALLVGCMADASSPDIVHIGVSRAATVIPPPATSRIYYHPRDCILINGQSNAVAAIQFGSAFANVEQVPDLVSFGSRQPPSVWSSAVCGGGSCSGAAINLSVWQTGLFPWVLADGDSPVSNGGVGQWGLHMGRMLMEMNEAPPIVLNGATGGQPISFFSRNELMRDDIATNYGDLLTRVNLVGPLYRCRTMIWYQGESDGAGGSGISATAYHDAWAALRTAWLEDYPTIERIYVVQVRPGVFNPTIDLLDTQRHFADEFPNVSVMSSTAMPGRTSDAAHYTRDGYWFLGEAMAMLLERDLYGMGGVGELDAPNPASIAWACGCTDRTQVVITMRDAASQMHVTGDNTPYFTANGTPAVSVTASGNQVFVTFPISAAGATIAYTGHAMDGPQITNSRGLGLLAFQIPAPL